MADNKEFSSLMKRTYSIPSPLPFVENRIYQLSPREVFLSQKGDYGIAFTYEKENSLIRHLLKP